MDSMRTRIRTLALCAGVALLVGACAADTTTGRVPGAGPMGPGSQPSSIAYVPNGAPAVPPVPPTPTTPLAPTAQPTELPAPPPVALPNPVQPAPTPAPTPTRAAATDDVAFTFQVGDQLEVSIWNEKELTTTHTVMRDGTIPAKAVGNVRVVGRTLEDVRGELTERYSSFLVDPRVSIRVVSVYAERVFVLGEVAKPAAVALGGRTTVMQAIAQAGGFTAGVADLKTIRIVRTMNRLGRPRVITHNADAVLRGRASQMQLMPGDVIYVHPTGLTEWSRELTAVLAPISTIIGGASSALTAVAILDGN